LGNRSLSNYFVKPYKKSCCPLLLKNAKFILSIYNESARTAKSGVIEIEALPAVTIEEGWYDQIQQDMKASFEQY